MPEVVEVCLTALFLNDSIKNTNLKSIKVVGGKYSSKPILNLDKLKLPMTIKKIDSKGKFMWFELSDANCNFYIMNSFGLAGEWGFNKKKHSDIEFHIDNGKILYFTDYMHYGNIKITSDINILNDKLNSLGDDFLKQSFTREEFYNRIKKYLLKKDEVDIKRKDKKIVEILMEQKKKCGLGSGLGNYLVAEILYDAKISPFKTILEIYKNREISNRLSDSIGKVVKAAYKTSYIGYLDETDEDFSKYLKKSRKNIDNNSNYIYNFHPNVEIKEVFKFSVYGQKVDPMGNVVQKDKIIKGRTTYWVPTIQK